VRGCVGDGLELGVERDLRKGEWDVGFEVRGRSGKLDCWSLKCLGEIS
jgi:hypothetical protein